MKIKAAEGRTLRDPRTGSVIPADGIEVPDHDFYWLRRVRDGDAVRSDEPPAEPAGKET